MQLLVMQSKQLIFMDQNLTTYASYNTKNQTYLVITHLYNPAIFLLVLYLNENIT